MLNFAKKITRSVFILALCAASAGSDYLGQKQLERTRSAMGTGFTITIFAGAPTRERNAFLMDKAFETIKSVEAKMYSQNEESVIWKVNHASAGTPVPVDDDTFFVLRESLRLSKISEGYFDISDAPLQALWAKSMANRTPPDAQAIEAALKKVNYQNILLSSEPKSLTLQKPGMEISIDEPARGYAADKALLYLKSQGVTSAMIKVGESMRWIGLSQEGRYWRFGIDHPRKVDEYAAVFEVESEGATSSTGDYEHFFIYKGERYPLVINPKTGSPPMNKVAGVTVTGENIAFANLLSHLFFILGAEKSYEFAERYKTEGIGAIFIEEPKKDQLSLSSSEGLHNILKDINL